jgi:hypothetical protein
MGYLGIIGVAFCAFAAIYNLAVESSGGPRIAVVWLILGGLIIGASRWLRARKAEEAQS